MDKHRAASCALAIANAHRLNARSLHKAGLTEYAAAVLRVGDIFGILAARCCTSIQAGRDAVVFGAAELRLSAQIAGTECEREYLLIAAEQIETFIQYLPGDTE